MYVGGRHTATLTETVDIPFRCAACGAEKTARIVGVGSGSASSPYFVGASRARDRAIEEASSDAIELAHRALSFVACPACGKTNAKSDTGRNPGLIVMFLVVGAVGGFVFVGALEGGIVGAALGCLLGILASRLQRRRAMLTAATVTFFDGEPPDKPVIGAKCKVCKRQIVIASDGTRCETCGAALHAKKCLDEHARRAHGPDEKAPYR